MVIEKQQDIMDKGEPPSYSRILEDIGWIRTINWKRKYLSFVSAQGRTKFPKCQVKAMVNICVDAGVPVPE